MYVHKPWKTFFAPTLIKYEKPTTNDYQYDVPTIWLDKTTDICYMLVDNTMGAAVWISRENTGTGDGVWTLYGDNAVRVAGNIGIGAIDPAKKLTVTGTFGAGTTGAEFAIDLSGNIVCGTVNGQTISNVASFTGTVNATTGFKISGAATSGNVLRGNGTNFVSATLEKSDVGLANVDNTSDTNKPISNATQSALDLKADLVGGKVPAGQLPSNFGLELGETSITAYYGDKGKSAYNHSLVVAGNPHAVTKSDVGLGNVDNTSDVSKPLSNAMIQAMLVKADLVLGKVPLEQLPSITYEIESYATGSAFPSTGNSHTYYVALDTMYVYLWGDDVGYVLITGSLSIADNSVTMAKLQNIDQNTVIGRVDSGIGDPKALSATELRSLLGSVGITADSAWAASGDLIVGTGNDTAAILSKGSSGQVLTAGASTLSWQTPATGGGTITDVTGTSPVVSSGGTTPAISMPAATNASAGHATAAHITAIEANTAKVTNATHTGDVTGSGALTIANNAVTLAKMANVDSGRVLYRRSSGTGLVEATALADLKSDLAVPSKVAVGAIDTGTDDAGFVTALKLKDSGVLNLAWSGEVNGLSAKSPIVDNDLLMIEDSAASYGKKKLLWSALKSTAKTYFDTLYASTSIVGYTAAQARTDLIANVFPVVNNPDKAPSCTAVVSELALKANLSGATFTGTVVANTILTVNTQANIKLLKLTDLVDLKIPYHSSTNGMLSSSVYFNSTNNGIGINQSGPTALVDIAPSTTTTASLRIRQSSAILGTINIGDLWFYLDGTTPKLNFRKTATETVDLLTVSANLWNQNSSYIYYSGGNVGIGINTPSAAQLVTYGSSGGRHPAAQFQNINVAGYTDVSVMCGTSLTTDRLSFGRCGSSYTSGGFANGAWIWNYGSGKLSFGTNSTENFAIAGNGMISGIVPDGKCYYVTKTQSATIANSTSVYSIGNTLANQFPFIAGVCVDINHTLGTVNEVTHYENFAWFPSFMSKVVIPSGAGSDQFKGYLTNIGNSGGGSATIGGNSNIGLVHRVQMHGSSGDLAAVWHMVEVTGQTANERAETAAISYYHKFDTIGKCYSSILEGQQIFDNMAYGDGIFNLGSRGGFGWHHVIKVKDAISIYMPEYIFINAVNSTAESGYSAWSGNYVVSMNGKWNNLFGSWPGFGPLYVQICGIDLYSNITYANTSIPALRIGSTSFIDLSGDTPNICRIGSSNGGLYVYSKTSGTSKLALNFADGATYMRIGSGYYLLTVSGTSIVATLQTGL